MRKLIPINKNTYLTKVKYPLQQKFNTPIEEKFKDNKYNNKNKRIDKLYEDKYNGLFEDEDFTRLYTKQIENRKQAEERIKQLQELEEKEDSSIDTNKKCYIFILNGRQKIFNMI